MKCLAKWIESEVKWSELRKNNRNESELKLNENETKWS